MNFRILTTICFVSALLVTSGLSAQDWPALRGADGTGIATTDGILTRSRKIGLKLRWKKKLGSGYSSVVVSGDKVVAMYCDETNDRIGCFSTVDGEQHWSVPIGEKYKGENGSFDGPISTPLIQDGFVYGLSPAGKLFCVNLTDGTETWSHDVIEKDSARKPMYGFATSPLMIGQTLIVQTGGKEKSVTAFDCATGEPKWACASDSIDSQSPALLEMEGNPIVLLAGGKKLTGVNPVDGSVLFEHPHGGGNGSAMVPVVYDENKILMTLDDGFSTAISIRKIDDQFQASEEWKQRSIKNTYNVPVIHDGNFYGYSTRILTCVDATTGEAKWKSREPGDGFLIVVDGHVITNTKRGDLHILRATPESYESIAGLKVFDDLVWSLPAFSNDAIFMRSLGEIACVDITGDGEMVSTESETRIGPMFASLIEKATISESPQTVVDEYLSAQTSFPLVEGDLAHFVYQGSATDVAVAGDMFGARQERKMQQIPGTNAWYYVAKLPKNARLNYVFLVDYKPQTDPRNDRTMTSTVYAGEMEFAVRLRKEAPLKMSWFGMSDWKEPKFTRPVEKLRGELVKKTVPSKLLDKPLEIQVYLPPNHDSSDQRFPVVYVYEGRLAIENGKFAEAADNIAVDGEGNAAIFVFFDGAPMPAFFESIASELVPFVDKEFNTIADRDSRICMSNGMAAGLGLQLLTDHNEVFGAASAQTPLVFDADQQRLIVAINELKLPSKIYLEWGVFDMFNPDENWDARKIGKVLYDEFAKSDFVEMSGGEVADSTDWASWRNRLDKVTELLRQPKQD